MRDPKRIDIIIKELKKVWKICPDLRLGQLVENICCQSEYAILKEYRVENFYSVPETALFYLEDDILLKRLKEYKKYLKSLDKT
jgi:hypothetical protein